ncbi:MAG: imidazole glycerol phosphate synthase subunit HisH [Bacillota bacterium]|uniref:Imidazole glycerol phosphate synthase subunit HisH n=1 Tax=Virgibacillus salarius TaxID=447199 RepID=A0A941DW22_9BACI|nr:MULTISPECIES: imidazole glycerol phosphate synthase subunit HisH [Bacillaceae]NAZ10479.1 imidazole glycerol phosphate synthase subunit HisH [Agaribacter marinus]MBR7797770.1 imidazole glycerol phosphate synthase subunit HisH [Virgibacillus salarius]MCC2252024.1 imidazole glycerol phosphate synthase subunit HisH [Virgibacillus sp. AGTR]MDY7046009.1 imidazole glycerol phosphate synthase subunit HisH [Virgibacillus sp. M23]QRZ19582.1 imidazole glycerol phosphate synthase subunit HisH [Virgibac
MIAIIDYGAGNMKSLQFALNRKGLECCVTTEKKQILNSTAMILPGVGAFQDAMTTLKQKDLINTIKDETTKGKPLLGICLGMQLFYETSEEDGEWEGFGLLKGKVSRINYTVKVPHIGWNTLHMQRSSSICQNIPNNAFVYYVHSYAVKEYAYNSLVASTAYGGTIPAIVQQDHIIGMQFHPEKSGNVGLQLLANFGEMIS